MQKLIRMMMAVLISILLTACGDEGGGSGQSPEPAPQAVYIAGISPFLSNRTDHTVNYKLTCEKNCEGFSQANANASGVVLAEGQLTAAQPYSTWTQQFSYDSVPLNQAALIRLSVTDGLACHRHQDVVVEGRPGESEKDFDISEACGAPFTTYSAKLDNYFDVSPMPSDTNELDVKLTASNAQSQLTAVTKSYDIKLNRANDFSQMLQTPISSYQVTAPRLLNSCDCVASLKNPTTFKPVWSGYSGLDLDYQIAPQKLMLSYALTSHYAQDYPALFSTMTKDGYNTALLTGLKFAKDDVGVWQLFTADGARVDNLIGVGAAGTFPQYMMPVLQIDNAASITDTTQLTDALWFVHDDNIGVDLVANNASQNSDNLSALIQALTGKFSNIHSIDLSVPADATQDDLKAIIKLKQNVLDSDKQWSGWIKLTSAQLQAVDKIAAIKDPQHWLVDMSDTAAKTTMADLLKSYQTMATKVNGLMVDDSGYNANDITALRHAVFLNQYLPSS